MKGLGFYRFFEDVGKIIINGIRLGHHVICKVTPSGKWVSQGERHSIHARTVSS